MEFVIQNFLFNGSSCREFPNITTQIFRDNRCNASVINRCIIQHQQSYFITCCNRTIDNIDIDTEKDICVLSLVLMFLILFLLFIIYKSCCEQYIDIFFIGIFRKMSKMCDKIKQPSFKYTTYSSI